MIIVQCLCGNGRSYRCDPAMGIWDTPLRIPFISDFSIPDRSSSLLHRSIMSRPWYPMRSTLAITAAVPVPRLPSIRHGLPPPQFLSWSPVFRINGDLPFTKYWHHTVARNAIQYGTWMQIRRQHLIARYKKIFMVPTSCTYFEFFGIHPHHLIIAFFLWRVWWWDIDWRHNYLLLCKTRRLPQRAYIFTSTNRLTGRGNTDPKNSLIMSLKWSDERTIQRIHRWPSSPDECTKAPLRLWVSTGGRARPIPLRVQQKVLPEIRACTFSGLKYWAFWRDRRVWIKAACHLD